MTKPNATPNVTTKYYIYVMDITKCLLLYQCTLAKKLLKVAIVIEFISKEYK